jgi:hypothetical protein
MPRKIHSVHLNKYMDEEQKNDLSKKKKYIKPVKKEGEEIPQAVAGVIKDALMLQLINNLKSKSKKREVEELEAMISTCQEFLQSFVIIGYDFQGNPIPPLIHANNQQEADALGLYLSKFINTTIRDISQKDVDNEG